MIRVGEIGKQFIISSGCDLTGIDTIVLKIKKPDGTLVDWTPGTIGSNSCTYVTVAGDLDQEGDYLLKETQYTFLNGNYFRGDPVKFTVQE